MTDNIKPFKSAEQSCNPDCDLPPCVTVRKAVEYVLRFVNHALESEREECARLVEQAGIDGYGTLAAAAIIRNRK